MSLLDAGATPDVLYSYTYDTVGRLHSVSNGSYALNNGSYVFTNGPGTFTYAYTANTRNLLASMTSPVNTTFKHFFDIVNLLKLWS